MNKKSRARLIELVRQHECLYDKNDEDFKNFVYKYSLWEKIGATLGLEVERAKDIWRSLRDGYVRYRKAMLRPNSSSRKYRGFTWSRQMAFLDDSLDSKTTKCKDISTKPILNETAVTKCTDINIASNLGEIHETKCTDSSFTPVFNEPKLAVASKTQLEQDPLESTSLNLKRSPSFSNHTSPVQPGSSWEYHNEDSSTLSCDIKYEYTVTETQQSPVISPHPSTCTTLEVKDNVDTVAENIQEILEHVRNKKDNECDDVDYLFISYAKSFKKLSVKQQTKMKVALAQMFAEAELEDLKNKEMKMKSFP